LAPAGDAGTARILASASEAAEVFFAFFVDEGLELDGESAAFNMDKMLRCFLATSAAFLTSLVLALAWGKALGFVTDAVPAFVLSRIFRLGVFFLDDINKACFAEPPLGELGGV
jgi:hypothetical protein